MIKKCIRCGKEFEGTSYAKLCPECKASKRVNKCVICGKEFTPYYPYTAKTCSPKCHGLYMKATGKSKEIVEKAKQTCLEKYGVEYATQNAEIQERIKQTNLERYGVESTLKSDEVQKRIKQTNLERYGVEQPLQSPKIRAKTRKTLKERYGVEQPLQSPEIQEKRKQTNLERYGVTEASQNAEIKEKTKKTNLERYGVTCSLQAPEAKEKVKKTNLEHYGVECSLQAKTIQEKIAKTNLERYGAENPFASEEIKNKIKETNQEKYGKDYYTQTDECREKIAKTNLERYGKEHYTQTDEYKERMKKINLDKYGTEYHSQSKDWREKVTATNLERYGVEYPCLRPEAQNYRKVSKINKSFGEQLKKVGLKYEIEYPIGKNSYDFKIANTLIEIDPTITHNTEISVFNKTPRALDYQLKKTKLAEENGYRCIHIFDWDDKNKIIKLLENKKKIYARQCKIQEITKKDAAAFLNKNHLQGSCRGAVIQLGLINNGELVEVMTLGKPRYNKKYEWELLRLCTKAEYSVIGGASKLFKHFIQEYKPKTVISYCDRAKFNGDVYKNLGFTLKETTEPNKVWSKGNQYITNNELLKLGYDKLFNTNYGKGSSNEELMLETGWLPVYDCGQFVFVYTE